MRKSQAIPVLASLSLFSLVAVALYLYYPSKGARLPVSPKQGRDPDFIEIVHDVDPIIADDTSIIGIDVPVTNPTSKSVRIKEIRRCCGILSAELATSELVPGQNTTLHLTMNAHAQSGMRTRMCSLCGERGELWSYKVRTTVYKRISFPSASIHFGSISPHSKQDGTAELFLCSRSEDDFPKSLQSSVNSNNLSVALGAPMDEVLRDGIIRRRIPLVLTLQAPATAGATNCLVTVSYMSMEGAHLEAKMSVVWHIKRLYEIDPPRVFFRKADVSSGTCERVVSLQRSDGKALVILGVKSDDPLVTVTADLGKPALEHRLIIAMDCTTLVDSTWTKVGVVTDYPAQPSIQIPVAALLPTP